MSSDPLMRLFKLVRGWRALEARGISEVVTVESYAEFVDIWQELYEKLSSTVNSDSPDSKEEEKGGN